MPVDSLADVKFEVEHVLFIDIVGYSMCDPLRNDPRFQKLCDHK
jgi:hypothetical protein